MLLSNYYYLLYIHYYTYVHITPFRIVRHLLVFTFKFIFILYFRYDILRVISLLPKLRHLIYKCTYYYYYQIAVGYNSINRFSHFIMLYYTHVPLTVSRLHKYIIYYLIIIFIHIIQNHTYFIHHRVSLIFINRPVLLLYHIIGIFNNNIFVSLLFIVHCRDVLCYFSCANFYNKLYILYT